MNLVSDGMHTLCSFLKLIMSTEIFYLRDVYVYQQALGKRCFLLLGLGSEEDVLNIFPSEWKTSITFNLPPLFMLLWRQASKSLSDLLLFLCTHF